MNIPMTPEIKKFVHAQLQSGVYQSEKELFSEALRLLVERDTARLQQREAMDQFIQEGLDAAGRGERLTPEALEADIEQLFDALKSPNA